ncbi:MAG: aminopeptidase [Candidatus Atribacteria bacterium]|nr:MAG: aminopeptidase [Candidatus Atribacteria bacterium]
MPDPRIEKLAQVLVNYSVGVKPADKVLIQGGPNAEPLLKAIYAEALKAGGYPMLLASLPGVGELLYKYGNDEQIQHIAEPLKLALSTYDCYINIMSPVNTKAMTNIPPEKIALSSQAQGELFETIMKRTAEGEFNWSLALFPTHASAQDAEMSLTEYEDFVYAACLPDMEDPIGYWKRIAAAQQKVVDYLDKANTLRVEGPDVDLRMNIEGRTFVNCCGTRNMPDGEVFTGPVEDSVEGHVRFSYPTTYQGRKLEGVHVWFEKGKVVKATADKGEDFLLKTIDTDEGARFVGEFAIGTNVGITRATGNTLFDEKIGGSFHMALGRGMPETGSVNTSAIHWDMVCDLSQGGMIWADDKLIYENGRFITELR